MTEGKKKRAKLVLKDFVEVERWDQMEISDTDILAHIREMAKFEPFPLEQFPRGEAVCFVWVVFCFVFLIWLSQNLHFHLEIDEYYYLD